MTTPDTPAPLPRHSSFRTDARWLVPLLALHLGLTVPLAWKLNLWIDEASSLETSGKTLLYALRQAFAYELQAPLYFALLNLWRLPSDSFFHARLFSVACVLLLLLVLVGLVRRYLPRLHPAWVVGLLALHPFTIWAATEIRVYALVLLLGAVLMVLFYDGFLVPAASPRRRWSYYLVALLSLYTYYFLGFLLVANAGSLLVQRRWRELRDYLGGMCLVALGIVPLLVLIPQQVTGYNDGAHRLQSLATGLQLLSWRLQELLLPLKWAPLAAWGVLLLAGFGLLTLVLFARHWRNLWQAGPITIGLSAVVTASFLLAAYWVTDPAFLESRHTTVLFLPVLLSLFACVAAVPQQKAVAGWALLLVLCYGTSLVALYSRPTKTGDWARVAQYLVANEKHEQPILVFQPLSAVPLACYYQGRNRLAPIPRAEAFRTFHDPHSQLNDEQELATIVTHVVGPRERLWLVTDELCRSINLDLNCKILEAYMAKHYEVEQQQKFFGSQVRLLRRKAVPQPGEVP